jgi:hypothetical protein
VRDWEDKQQKTEQKVGHLEEHRKNNTLILGMEERKDVSYLDTLGIVMEFCKGTMKLEQ